MGGMVTISNATFLEMLGVEVERDRLRAEIEGLKTGREGDLQVIEALRDKIDQMQRLITLLDHGGAAEIDCPICGHVFDAHESDCPLADLTRDRSGDEYLQARVERLRETLDAACRQLVRNNAHMAETGGGSDCLYQENGMINMAGRRLTGRKMELIRCGCSKCVALRNEETDR
jgi:hypothetical protein